MDEILASIRRIIADDEPVPRRPAPRPSEGPPRRPESSAEPVPSSAAPYGAPPAAPARVHSARDEPVRDLPLRDQPLHDQWAGADDLAAVEQERMEADIMADYPFQAPQGSVFPPAGPRAADPTAQRPAPARPPEATAFRSPPEPAARTPRRDVPPRDLPPRDLPPRDLPLRKELLSPDVDAAVSAAFESLGDLRVPAHERTVEDLVKEILRPMLKTWLDDNLPRIVERLVRQEIERVSRTAR